MSNPFDELVMSNTALASGATVPKPTWAVMVQESVSVIRSVRRCFINMISLGALNMGVKFVSITWW
jgi:hypothetical protein